MIFFFIALHFFCLCRQNGLAQRMYLCRDMQYSWQGMLTGHAGPIYTLAFRKDDQRLYSGSSDGIVAAWDLSIMQAASFSIKVGEPVLALSFHGSNMLIGQMAGGIHVIDLEERRELKHLKNHVKGVFDLCTLPERGLHAVAGGDGVLSVIDAFDFSCKLLLPLSEHKLRKTFFDTRFDRLLVGSSDGFIYVLEPEYFNELSRFEAHSGGVYDILPFGKSGVITGGRDAHLRFWNYDLHSSQFTEVKSIPAHNYAIYSIASGGEDQVFATASRDKLVKIWNPKDWKSPQRLGRSGLQGHSHSVNKVLFESATGRLFSAGDDRSIQVWAPLNPAASPPAHS